MAVVSDIIILSVAALALLVAIFALISARAAQRRLAGAFQEIAALGLAQQKLLDRLKHPEPPSAPAEPAPSQRADRKPQPARAASREPEHENLWQDVIFLAKQGLAADTIARDLNITRGEVELILGLHNFKPKKAE